MDENITRRRLLAFAGAGSAAAIAGLAGLPGAADAQSLPGRNLSVPAVKQAAGSTECGRACVVMVMRYFGWNVSLSTPSVRSAVPQNAHIYNHIRPSFWTLTKDSSNKLEGVYKKADANNWFDLLRGTINAGLPLIALIPNGANLGWNFLGHYVVVRGYATDTSGRPVYVFFNDPFNGASRVATKDYFARAWGTASSDAVGWQYVYARRVP